MTVDLYTDFDFEKNKDIVDRDDLDKPERLLSEIRDVKRDMEVVEARFNALSDEDLTEASIYELLALRARYRYLIKVARAAQIRSADIGALYAPVPKFSA